MILSNSDKRDPLREGLKQDRIISEPILSGLVVFAMPQAGGVEEEEEEEEEEEQEEKLAI